VEPAGPPPKVRPATWSMLVSEPPVLITLPAVTVRVPIEPAWPLTSRRAARPLTVTLLLAPVVMALALPYRRVPSLMVVVPA